MKSSHRRRRARSTRSCNPSQTLSKHSDICQRPAPNKLQLLHIPETRQQSLPDRDSIIAASCLMKRGAVLESLVAKDRTSQQIRDRHWPSSGAVLRFCKFVLRLLKSCVQFHKLFYVRHVRRKRTGYLLSSGFGRCKLIRTWHPEAGV